MQDSAVRKLCLGQHVNFHQAGVRSKGQGLKEELQFRAMLELQMLVHVRIVCNLQKVALKNSKFQKQSKENFDFDYLLVADETYIGVAEPTFVGSYKL